MVVMPFAFEVENRIDDVFEDLWTGDRAFFRDVPDQKDGNATVLREQKKLMRDFPHLGNRSRRGLNQRSRTQSESNRR